MNEAEQSRLAREQEIKRLKAQLALLETIQYDGHIIYWKTFQNHSMTTCINACIGQLFRVVGFGHGT